MRERMTIVEDYTDGTTTVTFPRRTKVITRKDTIDLCSTISSRLSVSACECLIRNLQLDVSIRKRRSDVVLF